MLLVFLASLLFVFFFQLMQGAYLSEFGSHPDEAAHCVTGLFVHDAVCMAGSWIKQGMHGSPLTVGKAFAEHYYAAYPKIGLGIWPPFFYVVQTIWFAAFAASRSSLLLLMATLTAALGTILFKSLREEFGDFCAAAGLAVFVSLPLIQNYSAMVMAEMLSALLMFAATLKLGRFIDQRKTSDAVVFGILAALAIMTKGTGLALGLMVLITIGFTRRWEVLKSRALWSASGIVLLVAGPWTWCFRNQGKGGWEEPSPSWHFSRAAFPYYLWKMAIVFGGVLVVIALLGLIQRIRKGGQPSGKWSALGGLILSVCIFQSLIPCGKEVRHLLPIVPAFMMFVGAGIRAAAEWLEARGWVKAHSLPISCAGLLILFYSGGLFPSAAMTGFGSVGDHLRFSPFSVHQKGYSGFGGVFDKISSHSKQPIIMLVSSDARGEGMLIAEAALADPHRPSYVVERASKFMSASTWSGGGYQNYYEDEGMLMKAILDSHIDFLAVDFAVPMGYRKPHHDLLGRLVVKHPEVFKPILVGPIVREGIPLNEPIRVSQVERTESGAPSIHREMNRIP